MTQNVADTWDDLGDDQKLPKAGPMEELGVTGVKRVGGYVEDEFLPALRGRKAVRVFREMSHNDSMVGALLFAIDKLVRQVEWKVTPADEDEESQLAADFLKSNMDDMSHSWEDFIGEALTMVTYGWSWHEIVYKKRIGPWEKNSAKKSKFTDGMIGWRKMPIRSQETLFRWIFDKKGGIQGMVQMAPPSYSQTTLPIEKCLLFRTSINRNSPEGFSVLRTAYRSWFLKKRLEEFEAIGVERDLAGMPVARVPAEYLNAPSGSNQHKTVQAFKKMVRGVRRDENEGILLPSSFDPDTKNQMFEFELMSAGGSRTFDTNALIQRYEQRILMSVLADFILVGHQGVGSYALHTDKTGIFRASLNAIVDAIADTLNRHAVPRLFEVNGWKLSQLPRFEPSDIDPPALDQLAAFISATAGAGMQWFPDPELEKFIRSVARLPELSPEAEETKRAMYDQQQAMEMAQQQMGMAGMDQKAQMIQQGMTPEQAEMAAQQPNADMQAEQMAGERLAADDAEMMHRQHPIGQEQAEMEQQQMQAQVAGQDPQAQAELAELGQQHEESSAKRQMEQMTLKERLEASRHQRQMERMKAQVQGEPGQPGTEQQSDQGQGGLRLPPRRREGEDQGEQGLRLPPRRREEK